MEPVEGAQGAAEKFEIKKWRSIYPDTGRGAASGAPAPDVSKVRVQKEGLWRAGDRRATHTVPRLYTLCGVCSLF